MNIILFDTTEHEGAIRGYSTIHPLTTHPMTLCGGIGMVHR
jgi:hypothetical protein